jgi:hypothetical protein
VCGNSCAFCLSTTERNINVTILMTKALTKSTSCVHQINFTYARECFSVEWKWLFLPRLQHFNTLNTILMFSTSRFGREKEPKSIYKYLIKRHRKSIKRAHRRLICFQQLQDILNVNVILFCEVSELIHIALSCAATVEG